MTTRCAAFAFLVGCAPAPALPSTGVVFADVNGDGVRQVGEPGVPDAVVAFERSIFTSTDDDGAYRLDPPVATGRVWVRVPAGFRPGAVWRPFGAADVDLPLVPLSGAEENSPLAFVVTGDSHVPGGIPNDAWDGGDLEDAFAQATSLADPPRFFSILGDLTTGATEEQFARLDDAVASLAVPWVPVAGNHDWFDGGDGYIAHHGLDNYAFDLGPVHVVVWNTNMGVDAQEAFLAAELADVPVERTVVALAHHSPPDEVADAMDALGVDYLFTAHWHANRRVQRGRMVEWSTQPLVMGAIDQSPPGYRIVTFPDDGGAPQVEFRPHLVHAHLALVAPHAGTCVSPDRGELLVAAALDASDPAVSVRVDCGEPQRLAPVGGWAFRGRLPALALGSHTLALEATSASGRRAVDEEAIEVCAYDAVQRDRSEPGVPRDGSELGGGSAPGSTLEWSQLGGGPAHVGARANAVTPPLVARWTRAVGGTLSLGSPVIAGDLAIVASTDHGDGASGGLVALDLATGAERWRYATPAPVVGTVAVAGDLVVVSTKSGEVHAVWRVDGRLLWRRDVTAGLSPFDATLWSPPTVAGERVYVAVQGSYTALDLVTGETVWSRTPEDPEEHWLGSLAAVTVDDGVAIAAFNRTAGLWAVDAATGASLWSIRDARVVAVNATPVARDGLVYVINAAGLVSALRLHTGEVVWTRDVTPGANDWSYAVTATPALADETLVVPTMLGELVAIDASTGLVRWRAAAAAGPLNFTHYRSAQAGAPSSPVVTGSIVWRGGLDGTLTARSIVDGHVVWESRLGAPITSAPAPAGDGLVVATFDGSVRLLEPGVAAAPARARRCPPWAPPGSR